MGPKFSARRRLGNQGEDIATSFLESRGFKVLRRNYLRKWGEIDIVAEKGGTVRFIEVKTVSREILPDISRENEGYNPEELVHPGKLAKLARTAETYMNESGDRRDYQIDVVTVFLHHKTRTARCRLYEQVL
jgi:putative endonuclease